MRARYLGYDQLNVVLLGWVLEGVLMGVLEGIRCISESEVPWI